MKLRIVAAIIVTSCTGLWAVVNAVMQKAVDIVSLPVEKWLKRGRYRDDINDNY